MQRHSLSFIGLILASLCFAASVTPSLIPRPYFVQGIVSGVAIAVGYGVGILLRFTWEFWELLLPNPTVLRWMKRVAVVGTLVVCGSFLWRMGQWQNSIRLRMEMPPIASPYRIRMLLIAIVVAIVLGVFARATRWLLLKLVTRLRRFLPIRIAYTLSVVCVVALMVLVGNGLIARASLELADAAFRRMNQWIDPGVAQPDDSMACGGPESIVPWVSIGRYGKSFLATGPTKIEIESFARDVSRRLNESVSPLECKQPIRVYASMQHRDDEAQAARLAVDELERIGGFRRKILVVATPTGTGWLQPEAVDSLEYLHWGDTAIVTTQYSYLPSWLTLVVDPQRPILAARALFVAVYDRWKSLPKKDRPQLYLHGLSLGALGSEVSADLMMIFEDPIDGAFWSGAPFPSTQWQTITANRNEGTPIWHPEFRDSRTVRFMNHSAQFDFDQPWGRMRNLYLQHPSDPMIWFSPNLAWHRPDWLESPRGADVSEELSWYPIVTFLQVAFDLPLATTVPSGYGHNYSASEYIRGWNEVTQPRLANGSEFDETILEELLQRFDGK